MSVYEALSDEELVSLCAKEDEKALGVLCTRYMKKARIIAFSLGVPSDDLNDLVQEGMLGFLSAIFAYKIGSSANFNTFASACIKNRMVSVLRKSFAKGKIPQELIVSYDEQAQSVSTQMTPEEKLISEKNVSDIVKALGKLTTQEEKAFSLYLEGMSYENIAQKLSLTVKAVDGTLQRARKKLRKALSL